MNPRPTESELQILQVLWERGPATVRQVNDVLNLTRETGYTTTLKQMQRMNSDKGLIRRVGQGTPHQFEAVMKEEEIQANLFSRLMNTAFKGSAMDLVMHALGQAKTDADEIAELEAWLAQQKNKTQDGNDE